MLDLVKVGKPRKEYKDWKNQKFLSLGEYLSAAKRAISYFAPKLRQGLSTEMLKNEDCISDVAYAMMKADWKYEPDQEMTQYNFRNNCALFAIRSYMTRVKRRNKSTKSKVKSLNDIISNKSSKQSELYHITIDKNTKDPCEIIEENEYKSIIDNNIKNSNLTDNEEYCIQEYYGNLRTYNDIANDIGLSKQRVTQIINNGMKKIRKILCSNG